MKACFTFLILLALNFPANSYAEKYVSTNEKIDSALAMAAQAIETENINKDLAIQSAHTFALGLDQLSRKYLNAPKKRALAVIDAIERFSEVSFKFPDDIQIEQLSVFLRHYEYVPDPQHKFYEVDYWGFDSLKLKAEILFPAAMIPFLLAFPTMIISDDPGAPDTAFLIGSLISGGAFFLPELLALKEILGNMVYNIGKYKSSNRELFEYAERIQSLQSAIRHRQLNSFSDCARLLKGLPVDLKPIPPSMGGGVRFMIF